MVRMQVQLTPEQLAGLRQYAQERGISVSAAAREAVDQWLPTARIALQQELRRRAFEATGKHHSGLTDVSEHHDDYLAEAYLNGMGVAPADLPAP